MSLVLLGDGHDCPRCGCNDTTPTRIETNVFNVWRGGACHEHKRVIKRRRCNYCGKQWTESESQPAK